MGKKHSTEQERFELEEQCYSYFSPQLYTVQGKKCLMVKITGKVNQSMLEEFNKIEEALVAMDNVDTVNKINSVLESVEDPSEQYSIIDIVKGANNKSSVPPEEVMICFSSPGGMLTSGYEIINFIEFFNKRNKIKISFIADGEVCSMATHIFIHGDRRFSFENCTFMIHPVMWRIDDNLPNMVGELKSLSLEQKRLNNVLSKNTNFTVKELDKIVQNRYIFPKEAKLMGIIEKIIK